MKRLFVVLLFSNLALFANAQVSASAKVKAANTSSVLKSYSEDQLVELNFRADHLVSVELSKSPITSDFNLALIENGKIVTLSDSDLLDFNPLLYAIPQEEVICNNFHFQSREGNSYTMVVLSKQQYNQQLKQYLRDINKKK
ncbi:MAG: hypothetical protein ACEQSL_05150 [Sediminibacterium sp.]